MKSLSELMDLQGRVALITGGGGHIGSTMGEALAELGAAVAVLDLAPESCQEVAERICRTYGVETTSLVVNLEHEDDVRSVPGAILDRFGRMDILVNCAALTGTSKLRGLTSPFVEQSLEGWRATLEVNLTGAFVLVQACAEALAASGHGSIINIGSIYGIVGPDLRLYENTPMGTSAAYGVAKGGLMQFTRWLATALAPQIRVNAITPGGVWRGQPEVFHERYVDRTPLRRMATEEDFKGAAAYLASDLSTYVTGHNLVVDGGWTAW